MAPGTPRFRGLQSTSKPDRPINPSNDVDAEPPVKEATMNLRPLAAKPVSLLAVSVSALLLAAPAHAEVVLDTFGPGDTAPGLNWSLDANQSLAVPFSLSSDSKIDDILTAISGGGTYQLGIVAGAPGGAFLYSTTLTDPLANSQANGLGWVLGAGDYWLVSKPSRSAAGPGQAAASQEPRPGLSRAWPGARSPGYSPARTTCPPAGRRTTQPACRSGHG